VRAHIVDHLETVLVTIPVSLEHGEHHDWTASTLRALGDSLFSLGKLRFDFAEDATPAFCDSLLCLLQDPALYPRSLKAPNGFAKGLVRLLSGMAQVKLDWRRDLPYLTRRNLLQALAT
jgi:hypothetical protein